MDPVEEKARHLTPFARAASSTLKVATVFCSRSLRGCSVPNLTSALAARWKTVSQPRIDAVSEDRSRLSPRTSEKREFLSAPSRNRSCPVEKLSHPTTAIPSPSRRSARFEPMNPAAPVTKTFCMWGRGKKALKAGAGKEKLCCLRETGDDKVWL